MATQLEQLLVRIDASTEGLRRELKRAEEGLEGTARRVDGATRRINTSFLSMDRAASRALRSMAATFSAGAIIKAASSMQQLDARLNALTGSSKAAGQALDLLRDMSRKQAVELSALADGFGRLLPAVKSGRISFDEMQQILRLANDNIKAFGLGASEAQGLFLGLSQALGSGTVTMEDLRQVTDRLPGSLDRMAAAMGKDVAGLKAMVATGEFTADMLKGPLLEAFKANEGAAAKMADTFESAMTDMKNAFNEFGAALANSGVLDILSGIIREIANAIRFLNLAIEGISTAAQNVWLTTEQATEVNKKFMKSYQDFVSEGAEPAVEELKKLEGVARANIDATEKLTKAQKALIEKQKEYKDGLALTIEQQRDLADAASESAEAYEFLKAAIDAENEAREQGFKKGTREFQAVKAAIMQRNALRDSIDQNLKRYEKERQAQEEYAKELMKPWDHAMENVQDQLAEMFEKGSFSFKSLTKIAKKLAAEVAAAWVIRAMVVQPQGSAGGSTGGMMSMFSGSSGGGGGGTSLGNVANMASTANSAYNAISGGGSSTYSSVVSGVDSVGSFFGVGDASFIGPMQNGGMAGGLSQYSSFTNAGAATGLMTAGAGYVGNLGGNAFFGDDRGEGAAIGSAVGTLIGSIWGPIGALIGSFLGNAVGGLFGNNTPSGKMQGGNINLAGGEIKNTYGMQGKTKFSQQNLDAAKSLLQFGQSFSAVLTKVSGQKIDQNLNIEVSSRDGVAVKIGDGAQQRFSQDKALQGLTTAIADLSDQANQSIIDIKTALKNIDFKDTEQALKDLAFAASYDSLGDPVRVFTELEVALDQVNKQFIEAAATASKLGLDTARLTKYQEEQMKALSRGYISTTSNAILSSLAPQQLALMQEQNRYTSQLRDLHLLNAGAKEYQIAEFAHQLQMQQIIESNSSLQQTALEMEEQRLTDATELARRFQSVGNSFRNILNEIQYGKYSDQTPVQNLESMRQLAAQLGTAAAGGDADAAEQLGDLLPAFLELSGEVNGFNAQYRADRMMAENLAISTISTAERQVALQNQLVIASQRQIEVMQTGFGTLQAALDKFGKGLTVNDIVNSAGNVASNTLRVNENASSILGFNSLNNLAESTVRQLKASVGFDFSAAENQNRSFADWVRSGNQQAGAIFNQKILSMGGKPQTFATGGDVMGATGVDQIDARLSDGEFVTRRNAVRSIGRANMHYMNRTGRMPSADNSDVVQGLHQLTRAVGQLINVTAATGSVTTQQLDGVKKGIGELNLNARLVAAL